MSWIPPSRRVRRLVCAAVLALATVGASPGPPDDALGAAIARWSAFLRDHAATNETWKVVKQGAETALARAAQARADGRPLLALLRFGYAHEGMAAAEDMARRPAAAFTDAAAFEAEWTAARPALGARPDATAFAGVEPAAVRAIGEAALPQARVYYDASVDYGRNTMPESGLYYLGAAKAWQDFAAFVRTLSRPAGRAAPGVRALAAELDMLEGEMLAAYRPPASIDAHRDFILASAALKEARELDAAGLAHGALLRYLQSAQRLGAIRRAGQAVDGAAVAARLRDWRTRLEAGPIDHSVGLLFVEAAEADLAEAATAAKPVLAAAIVEDVLARYEAALRPAAARPAVAQPAVTVTLVRWPYT